MFLQLHALFTNKFTLGAMFFFMFSREYTILNLSADSSDKITLGNFENNNFLLFSTI